VEAGFSPLDEELALGEGEGSVSPRLHEWLVRLAAWMPFEQAAKLLSDFVRVQVSQTTTRRQTEAAGAAYVAIQSEEVELIERALPPAPQGPAKQLLSVDGAMVPLLGGQWAEVKTLVLGEVGEPMLEKHKDGKEEWVIRTTQLSYFSRMTDADTFGRLALVETQRRGVERAGQVGAVMDGAEWQQGFVDYHCPQAVRVLDFPHAAERLSGIAGALWGESTPRSKQWLEEQCHQLKHEGPRPLLAQLRALQQAHPDKEVLATNLAYLGKREEQMQYPRYQKEGWPLGSGVVESGNKVVVQARLKGAGMHWEGSHVNPMLGLRNVVCNDRWAEGWPQITRRIRQQRRGEEVARQQVRQQQRKRRREQLGARPNPKTAPQTAQTTILIQPELASLPKLTPTQPVQAKPKDPWRPAADHPWRRSPIGRARFQIAKAS
jgi:hypothetical protein